MRSVECPVLLVRAFQSQPPRWQFSFDPAQRVASLRYVQVKELPGSHHVHLGIVIWTALSLMPLLGRRPGKRGATPESVPGLASSHQFSSVSPPKNIYILRRCSPCCPVSFVWCGYDEPPSLSADVLAPAMDHEGAKFFSVF